METNPKAVLPETMRALVKTQRGAGNMEILSRPLPVPAADEVLVKVHYVGVCGTDLKIYDDTFYSDVPVIVGHEFSGEVAACGSAVQNYKPGDRVVAEQHWKACGTCRYCLTGKRHLCLSKRSPGYLSDGAYADYIAVKESLLHRVPDAVSLKEACLIEPMGIVAHGLMAKCQVEPNDTIVILGCGPIALMALQIVKALGAGKVCITGLSVDEPVRFPLAKSFGADALINVEHEKVADWVKEATNGVGADMVIELSGAASAISGAFEFLRRDGKFLGIGLPKGDVALPYNKMVLSAVNLYFSFSSGAETWDRCLWLLESGKMDLSAFSNDVYPLADWEAAFDDARKGKVLKAIIQVN